MEDFRTKLQEEIDKLLVKIRSNQALTPEEMKTLFLSSYLNEEQNEQ